MSWSLFACDPALSRTTVVTEQAVTFTVLLQDECLEQNLEAFSQHCWDVAICHNGTASRVWTCLHLIPQKDHPEMLYISPSQPDLTSGFNRRCFYAGTLTCPSALSGPVNFTVKARKPGREWQWINDHSHHTDGELCFQIVGYIPSHIEEYLQDSDDVLYIRPLRVDFVLAAQGKETRVWALAAPIEAAQPQISATRTVKVGLPRMLTRWFSIVRISRPWLAPRQGKDQFSLTEDAILASFLRWDGLHIVLLAITLEDVLTVFKSDEKGYIVAFARNDSVKPGQIRILTAVAKTFEDASAAVMHHARTIVGTADDTLSEEQRNQVNRSLANTDSTQLEEWHDSFTYCTWNGLGLYLDEHKILDALKIMENSDIQVNNLIIDDNWQSLDYFGESEHDRRWTRFEANEIGFPKGLKHTVAKIREAHPHVKHITVWHGIFGYWGGTSPSGDIAMSYKTRLLRLQERGFESVGSMTAVDADDAHRMYDDFYNFLTQAGITSVKADTQFFLDHLNNAEDRRRFITTYQNAWSLAALKYFGLKVISCMSLTPQVLFHSYLPTGKPCFTVRNSDDFFPNDPTSHSWHVFLNAHNAVLTKHFNIIPDWDMFQTNHSWSAFHAAARCVSGGLICFTDEPGKHDLNLINQMTAKTPAGRVILRPEVGKTTNVYAAHKAQSLCKISTYWGGNGAESAILGVFNVGRHPITEIIKLRAFQNIRHDQAYVIHSRHNKVSRRVMLEDEAPVVVLSLEEWGYQILTAVPLHTVSIPNRPFAHSVAVLGLLGKMTGVAAIRYTRLSVDDPARGVKIKVALKALGRLGIYFKDLPPRPWCNFEVLISGNSIPWNTCYNINFEILEIDLEDWWAKFRDPEKHHWQGEVVVEVYFLW